jgi:hypothetical protein
MHFTAVLRIDKNIGCLQIAKNYLYMLAGVLYSILVLAVKKLLSTTKRKEEQLIEEQIEEARKRFLK